MNDEPIELVRGSGNVFRDFGYADADIQAMKAELAAKIISVLDERGLSVRKAGKLIEVQPADISRVRNADLDKFSVEWLTKVFNRLSPSVEVSVQFSDRENSPTGFAV